MTGTVAPVRRVDTAERRARLAARHAVHPDHRVATIEQAAETMVCLHGTDPAGVYLAGLARVAGLTVADVDRALYVDRTLVKHLGMRRTLWVVTRGRLPVMHAAAGPRVADGERRALVRDVERAGLHADGARWLDHACAAVVGLLADGRRRSLDELRHEVPALRGAIEQGAGRSWGGRLAVGPRVLAVLSAQGRVGASRQRRALAYLASPLVGDEHLARPRGPFGPGRAGRGHAGRLVAARLRARHGS